MHSRMNRPYEKTGMLKDGDDDDDAIEVHWMRLIINSVISIAEFYIKIIAVFRQSRIPHDSRCINQSIVTENSPT